MKHLLCLYVLIVMLVACHTTKAETFVVINNNDSGQGSFRYALQRAEQNGKDETDSIHFNLGLSEAERTITIIKPLIRGTISGRDDAIFSENLIIDGTSQPGEKLGISDAKVILVFDYTYHINGDIYNFLVPSNVSVFGIFFKLAGSVNFEGFPPLVIIGNNIRIGMSGKGNAFYKFGSPLAASTFSAAGPSGVASHSDIIIQSNIFGLDIDGSHAGLRYATRANNIPVRRYYAPVYLGHLFGKVKIGGSEPGEGNTFATGLFISDGDWWGAVDDTYTGTDLGLQATYEIIGNRLGVFAERDVATLSKIVLFIRDMGEEDTITIRDNVFGGAFRDNTAIEFKDVKAKVDLEKNFIGVSRTGNKLNADNGLLVINTPRLKVAENTIGHLDTAFLISNPKGIEISRNRIFCNANVSPMYESGILGLAVVAITSASPTLISGTATPGSRVELFSTDACGTCNPETFIGETIANASGNWSYSGNFTKDIIASATLDGATSEFTRPAIPIAIDLNTKTIKNTCVANAEGIITGITIVNESQYTYQWKQVGGGVVGSEKDLMNVFPGKYYLEVKKGNCGIVTTDTLEVLGYPRPVATQLSPVKTNVSCSGRKGSLKGITVTNTLRYEWFKDSISYGVSTTTADIDSLEEGEYMLTASNEGCSNTFGPFKIEREQPATRPDLKVSKVYPCGDEKGSLSINLNQPGYRVRWTDEAGTELTRDTLAGNLPAGRYNLYLSDPAGCVYPYGTYDLELVSPLTLNDIDRKISPDSCAKLTGSIKGLTVSYGKGPYKYLWTNETGNTISSELALTKAPAGTYRLEVSDSTACSGISDPFVIDPIELTSPAPVLRNIQLCTAGSVIIKPESILPGKYSLYESETTASAIEENETGIFKLQADASKIYYLTYKNGSCESEKVPVKVTISSTDLKFPGIVSPNGDGINDTWNLQGISNYSNALVRIFNRLGGLVYQSVGYSSPFDGTSNGKPLPEGSYYYVVELSKDCKAVSGNLTIVR